VKKIQIAPSLLSADFSRLAEEVRDVERAGCDVLHIDVMDGHFVPNLTIGPLVVAAIRQVTKLPLDVHLMIEEPERYIAHFIQLGASILTFHVEATHHVNRVIQLIKQSGVKAGISLNPHTPVSMLENILPDIDVVLIMSVNPGFGGQKFLPLALDKVKKLNQMRKSIGAGFLIEVDGGVDEKNASMLIDCGVDVLVAGNTIFSSSQPEQTIQNLKQTSLSC